MNKSYRLIWSELTNTWIAVAETVKARGKRASGAILLAGLGAVLPAPAFAAPPAPTQLPTGGEVVAGTASIAQSNATLNINQSSARAAIDWQTFNVGSSAAVNFNQPNAASVTLNRVLDSNPSQIFGRISAPGQVFLTNPNGVYFSASASVDVGGLVATTHGISNADFMAGNVRFSRNGATGSVINDGELKATLGGYIALLAPEVRNQGVIIAQSGTVALAAGEMITLNFSSNSLTSLVVTPSQIASLVENNQAVQAPGGLIILSAQAANTLQGGVVNNSGTLEATGLVSDGGRIMLDSGAQGTTRISGTLDATSATGKGGHIEVTGQYITVEGQALLDASGASGGGEVLVGGSWQNSDPSVRQATTTYVASTALIKASATDNGNGGTVVAWSDVTNAQSATRAYGSFEAKGGPNGGDGGRIETSGHWLDVAGIIANASAIHGTGGVWLLDPNDITIQSPTATTAGPTFPNWTSTADSSVILNTDIQNQLNAGTSVTITTGTGGANAQTGNITVSNAIAKTSGNYATLTLLAINNIDINAAITSTSNRLNVVLTADSDGAGGGSVAFGAAGRVETNGGNFYVGSVSGSYDTVAAKGQNFTMASGSYVNIGNGGSIEVSVNGNITLPNNSAQATTYGFSAPTYTTRYFNNGTNAGSYGYVSQIKLTSVSGSITSANTNAATADIVTAVNTYLSAGTIGSTGTPIRISGPADLLGLIANPVYSSSSFPNVAKTLYTTNTAGSSYINEIGTQVFNTVNLTVGSQASSTQNVQIMGDAGGNGTTGTGHIILTTDGAGLLNVATGNIKTAGTPGGTNPNTDPVIWPTSVTINAPNITFANNAVDTGSSVSYYLYPGSYYTSYWGYSYYASFVATANGGTGTLSSIQNDTTGDINSYNTTLNAVNIGTSANPVELGTGTYLYVNNTGGNTYIKSVANNFSQLNLTNVKTSGIHSILFSGGDHIDYTTNGSGIIIPTIGGTFDLTNFAATTGIDVHNSSRTLTLTANSGYVEFDTNAVNTGSGNFTTNIYYYNTDRSAGKAIYAKNAKDAAAEITAADISFYINNSTLGHISDIEIAKGGSSTSNSLTINTYQGNVDVTELTANHFKSLNVTLNGASLAQTVAIALAGLDDVNFSDSGSLVTIDATKVNLSSNNRNWNLNTPSRTIQVDGVSLGSGHYTLYGGTGLKLNTDVLTNGGNINLTGYGSTGIALMKSLRIDSNADDLANSASTGSAGSISLSGTISGVTSGYALTVDSGSTTTSGSSITMNSNTGNSAGAYLSGLTLTSKGSTNTNDGTIIYYGSSYLLNGNFLSTGYSSLQSQVTIDTEQGNIAAGGNITFAGRDLYSYPYYNQTFNTSTTAAGLNAGNVDLYGTFTHSTLSLGNLTVTATSGAGGTAGNISLPSVSSLYEGYSNTQSYTGGIITLNGNLSTNRGSVTLTGDTRLASNVTIDTWSSASSSYSNGTAGSVTINGTGVSATAAGRTLTVNTGTNTGTGYVTGTTYWNHSGGAVNIKAGNAGGNYLSSLTVDTTKGGTYNNGTNGNLTLSGIATTGNQTYTGAATTIAGDLTTDGGIINLSSVSSLLLSGSAVAIMTDMTGGTSAAGTLNLGTNPLNGATALTINTTADGGGAASALTLYAVGNTTPLTSLDVKSSNLTFNSPIIAAGNITLQTTSTSADLTLTQNIISNSGNIVLASGRNFINNVDANVLSVASGHTWQVWSTDPANDTRGGIVYGFKQYNATYGTTAVQGSGKGFLYTLAPTLTSSLTGTTSKVYDGTTSATLTLSNFSLSGFLTGDADTGTITAASTSGSFDTANVGSGKTVTSTITSISSITDGAATVYGYQLSTSASGAIGSISKAPLSITASNASKTYNGLAYSGGNGVTYSGFVNNETSSILGGILDYIGDSQGALTAGSYVITPRGLSGSNYTLTFVDGILTINAAAPNIPTLTRIPTSAPALPRHTTTPSLALAPSTASTATGDAGGAGNGGISVSMVRPSSAQQTGIITVSVPKETATAGSGFTFTLPAQITESSGGNTAMRITTLTGDPLPSWLHYVPETKTFVASAVPDGAFPMQVLVTIGDQSVTVVISERSEQ